ncbi:MAG: proteobacterial dedicated sortase system histidine kinase [Gammaproteobacteria bacterium]|nr:proteobacterial dedicated sortase system histidine kinase [Gammaproteobacteria bacterium]
MKRGSPGKAHLFTLSLRTKLLLVALALLVIPWTGYQYVRQMEAFLRRGQEEALLATARAVARVMHEQPELFRHQGDLLSDTQENRHLYVRPLDSPIQLDGYDDDWLPYRERGQYFGAEAVLESRAAYDPKSLSFRLLTGTYDHYLYVLFEVTDDRVVYRQPSSLRLDQSDHLQIALQDAEGEFHRYLLSTSEPGWVNAHRMPNDTRGRVPGSPEIRIKGEWQETAHGYTLELRMPLHMIGSRLAFAIGDVDDPRSGELATLVGTAGTRAAKELGTVMVRSLTVTRLLRGLERSAGRIWVVDRNRRVLALTGSLQDAGPETKRRPFFSGLMHALYRLILKQPAREFQDELSSASRLHGPEIQAALHGQAATEWRQTPDQRVAIVAAAHPIWSEDEVLGAVVVERTSNSILILQNRAMENLINTSLVVFLVATAGLLVFAARLAGRVSRLRDDAENAIGPDGRVRGTIRPSRAGDEIGDLSRSFADVLERLQQYTRYLETMAGKLSHELRTPMTVVRSSLDNLEMSDLDSAERVYLSRARDGLRRLDELLTRMSEATRLEQALQKAEREDFDLGRVVAGCADGFRTANPDAELAFMPPNRPCIVHGVPDLIAQLMDKLVGNALDFRTPGTPITIELAQSDGHAQLLVCNEGPPLPEEMRGNLFDSMVSIRTRSDAEAHLGLGLYIVRLIAEFHHGTVQAQNAPRGTGAIFTVTMPSHCR